MREGNCNSCGQGLIVKGSTLLPCPMCGTSVGRCGSCREQAVDFSCASCGFAGP